MHKEIPIFFSTDDNYIPYLDVAVSSLIANASKDYDYRIIVLNTGLCPKNIAKVKRNEQPGFIIDFVDISENLENIYNAIHKYLAPDEENSFKQILSAVRTMKNVREMQQMLELFQSLNPDMDPSAMMDGLNMGSMNGMDLSELMKLFGTTRIKERLNKFIEN